MQKSKAALEREAAEREKRRREREASLPKAKVVKQLAATARRPQENVILLAQIPSKSKKDVLYDVYLDINNSVYCTCEGWAFRHACAHLETFRETLIAAASK